MGGCLCRPTCAHLSPLRRKSQLLLPCVLTGLPGLSRLRLELALESRRERQPTAITMLVTFTGARLGMLPGQCASWGGVLSAAVYLPHLAATPAERAEALATTVAIVQEAFERCHLASSSEIQSFQAVSAFSSAFFCAAFLTHAYCKRRVTPAVEPHHAACCVQALTG